VILPAFQGSPLQVIHRNSSTSSQVSVFAVSQSDDLEAKTLLYRQLKQMFTIAKKVITRCQQNEVQEARSGAVCEKLVRSINVVCGEA